MTKARRRFPGPIALLVPLFLGGTVAVWAAASADVSDPGPDAGVEQPGDLAGPGSDAAPEAPEPAPRRQRRPIETMEVFAPRDPFGSLTGSAAEGDAAGRTLVRLISIDGGGDARRARVRLGDASFDVAAGEVFAEDFQLLSASGRCAALLHGDDQFSICEGEELLK